MLQLLNREVSIRLTAGRSSHPRDWILAKTRGHGHEWPADTRAEGKTLEREDRAQGAG
jgi:hypothetical protein